MNLGSKLDFYHFADETNISKLDEESNDVQGFRAEIVEEVKWLMVVDEDENVKEDIWEDITFPKIHAKVTAIQEANITRIETKEVEEESFEHDQWLNVTEGESWADIVSREIPLEDITVLEVARNLQWSDQVDAEYETETQSTTEKVHSVKNLIEKVSQDTEMKEMETAEVQKRSEDNKEIAKEIKVLRLTWEELLLAERHMESEKHAEAEIQPNNEQVHSGESHDEKVSRDTEMKEMETAQVQETCEDNKDVAKEIKVLRLTWEELLLAERHMESAVVEDLSSDQVKSTRLTLAQEDPAIQAFKIISNDR